MGHNPEEGEEELIERLVMIAEGAAQKAAEGNIFGAFEEFYVGESIARAAMATEAGKFTPERMELVSRLAWAQSELESGHSTRVPDDLERVEELAREVYDL